MAKVLPRLIWAFWLDPLGFFWDAFVTSFCLRLPLLAMLLLILGLVSGTLGQGVGIPDLVYHDDPLKQLCGGLSLGLLTINTLLIGFLLFNADEARRNELSRRRAPTVLAAAQERNVPRTADAALAISLERATEPNESRISDAAPATPLNNRRREADISTLQRWFYVVGILLCLLGTVGMGYFGRFDDGSGVENHPPPWGQSGTALAILALGAVLLLILHWNRQSMGWRFLFYSIGIVICFLILTICIILIVVGVASYAGILGLGYLPLPAPSTTVERPQLPFFLPLVAGGIDAVLLVGALLALASSTRMRSGASWARHQVLGLFSRLRRNQAAKAAQAAEQGKEVSTGTYHLFLTFLVMLGAAWFLFLPARLAFRFAGDWSYAFLVGLLVLAPVVLLIRWWFPLCWSRLVAGAAENTQVPAEPELRYHSTAVLMLLAMTFYHLLLTRLPWCVSPVTVVCFFLFLLMSAYGLAAYTIHRVLPILVGGLLLLVLFGGIPPFKFRFDGLPGDHNTYDARVTKDREVLDLDELAKAETELQAKGDEMLWKHEDASDNEHRNTVNAYGTIVLQNQAFAAATCSSYFLMGPRKDHLFLAEFPAKFKDEVAKMTNDKVRPWIDPRQTEPIQTGGLAKLLVPADLAMQSCKCDGNPKDEPLVVVAVSGGGLRSAVWTLRVLQTLEKDFAWAGIDFPSRVRVICGASGGMLGAAYYVTTLPSREKRLQTIAKLVELQKDFPTREALREKPDRWPNRWKDLGKYRGRLTQDFLTPILQCAVYNDFPSFFSPYPNLADRGKALEQAWEKSLGAADPNFSQKPALDLTFDDLRQREKEGDWPSLVFSPMLVEDGRRLLISNLDLRYVLVNSGNRLVQASDPKFPSQGARPYSLEGFELFRLFPKARPYFKLGTAVRMSATFPYFTPAASLPTAPRRRVVDAGYYDNYGVSLAASWLFSAHNTSWIDDYASKILLVQIRDSISDPKRTLARVPGAQNDVMGQAIEELSSPPEGLYNGAFAAASFRNDGQLELLSNYFRVNRARRAVKRFEREVANGLVDPTKAKDVRRKIEASLQKQVQKANPAWSYEYARRLAVHAVWGDPNGMTATLNDVRKQFRFKDPKWAADELPTLVQEWLRGSFPAPEGLPRPPHANRYFTTVTFEYGGTAALSWYLSRADRIRIERAIRKPTEEATDVTATSKAVIKWWNAPVHD